MFDVIVLNYSLPLNLTSLRRWGRQPVEESGLDLAVDGRTESIDLKLFIFGNDQKYFV